MTEVTDYVALAARRRPMTALPWPSLRNASNPNAAVMRAKALRRKEGHVGASRPLRRSGDLPPAIQALPGVIRKSAMCPYDFSASMTLNSSGCRSNGCTRKSVGSQKEVGRLQRSGIGMLRRNVLWPRGGGVSLSLPLLWGGGEGQLCGCDVSKTRQIERRTARP